MFKQEARRTTTELLAFFKTFYSANELKIVALGGLAGSFVASALGGFDKQLIALCWLSLIDFVTGVYAAWHDHTCRSGTMYRGFFKKLSIFGAVAVAVLLDDVLAVHTFRFAAIGGFGIMEALSIVENADRGGYGDFIPVWIRQRLAELKEQRFKTKKKDPQHDHTQNAGPSEQLHGTDGPKN